VARPSRIKENIFYTAIWADLFYGLIDDDRVVQSVDYSGVDTSAGELLISTTHSPAAISSSQMMTHVTFSCQEMEEIDVFVLRVRLSQILSLAPFSLFPQQPAPPLAAAARATGNRNVQ